MKRTPFPIPDPRDQPVLDRVEMQVIHAPLEIGIVSNLMFPEPALPNAAFTPHCSRGAQPRVVLQGVRGLAAELFDHVPAQAIIAIVFGQRPDGVQVVGQQHPGIDAERMVCARACHRVTQGGAKPWLEQDVLALVRDDGEEEGAAWGLGAAVIGHGSSVRVWDVWAGLRGGALKSAPYGAYG
jgi:hypothetical protein